MSHELGDEKIDGVLETASIISSIRQDEAFFSRGNEPLNGGGC